MGFDPNISPDDDNDDEDDDGPIDPSPDDPTKSKNGKRINKDGNGNPVPADMDSTLLYLIIGISVLVVVGLIAYLVIRKKRDGRVKLSDGDSQLDTLHSGGVDMNGLETLTTFNT